MTMRGLSFMRSSSVVRSCWLRSDGIWFLVSGVIFFGARFVLRTLPRERAQPKEKGLVLAAFRG